MNTHKPVPWHQVPMTWLVFGIPLITVIVCINLIVLSVRSFDGLVVDDYYKQGLGINQVLQRKDQASSYQLNGTLDFSPDTRTVYIQLQGENGYHAADRISLGLYHSTQSGNDHEIPMELTVTNQYVGDWPALAPGRWNVLLESPDWRLEQTLTWPSETRSLVFTPGE